MSGVPGRKPRAKAKPNARQVVIVPIPETLEPAAAEAAAAAPSSSSSGPAAPGEATQPTAEDIAREMNTHRLTR